jgi:hypothetical protein
MSYAFTAIKGLTYYDRRRAHPSVVLMVPRDGDRVWLIDRLGNILHDWKPDYRPIHADLLPNGNVLYTGLVGGGPLTDFEGAGGIVQEVDRDGNVVWEHQEPYQHHAACRTKAGNTLILKWVKVPPEIAARVQGGDPGTEREGVMWGDAVQEITPEGKAAWEWTAHEHLDPDSEKDASCPICPRSEWTHADAVIEMPDDGVLVSLMETHTLAVVDKKAGDITWRWGGPGGELAHQHSPQLLDNGNILVFDNGLHPRDMAKGYSRILEISRRSGKIVWSFGAWPDGRFFSSIMGDCQRLANGNTFVCESTTGRLFELSAQGELVWEYVNNLPVQGTVPSKSRSFPVYCAYCYGADYSGLRRGTAAADQRREAAPGNEDKEEKAIASRLERLGY